MSTVPFEQVILRGCGTDAHKDVVAATISGEGLKTETRSYKTFSSSLTELKEWLLLLSGITHVAMEVPVFTGNLSTRFLNVPK